MRHRTVSHVVGAFAALLLAAGLASPAAAQQLELGRVVGGSTSDTDVATLSFRASAAGVLTVVVRATQDEDLVLVVADGDGQPLPDGRSDQDLGGVTGAEQVAVTIPRAGAYQVRVEMYGSGKANFQIGASWLPFPALEVPPDPDGSPSTAQRLTTEQQSISDSIDESAGDHWDWFVVTADRSGTLTVATRAPEGDLVLEAFEDGEFDSSLERSDQDLQGVNGNEALTLSVTAGQTLYFKVSMYSGGSAVQYRLQVGFIPG